MSGFRWSMFLQEVLFQVPKKLWCFVSEVKQTNYAKLQDPKGVPGEIQSFGSKTFRVYPEKSEW